MAKTVLITGASGGIGSEIARKFADNNYNIIYHYNNNYNEKFINELAGKTKILPVKANFENCNEIITMFDTSIKTFGKIDVLINNAGIDSVRPIVDENEESISKVMQINLTSSILLTSLVSKEMCKNHIGSIVNISSIWGVYGGSLESVYSATKAGLIGFTKAIAKELGVNGVRANAVAPGLIDTKMNNNLTKTEKQDFINNLSLNSIGSPKDVANAVYFLASDESKYITGQVLGVDGGF